MDQLRSVRLFAIFNSNPPRPWGYTPRTRLTASMALCRPCDGTFEFNNPMTAAIASKSACGIFCLPFCTVRCNN